MDSTASGPAWGALPITPSNTVDIRSKWVTRGVYVGTGGNITAVINNVAVLFTAVPQGVILPINCTRVNATGTTASNLVALF